MILYIDTTDFNKVTFAVSQNGKIKRRSYKIDPHKSYETLSRLDDFLKKSEILDPKSSIQRIVVNKGPGSYTGTRVGAAHALALSFGWGIPIKAISKEKFSQVLK